MKKTLFFVTGLVVLFLVVGCKEQTPTTAPAPAPKCVGDKCPVVSGIEGDSQKIEAVDEVTDEYGRPQRKHRFFRHRQK